ncbi:MAG: MFS transporter [Candidatus Korobacteraceae bacterium]
METISLDKSQGARPSAAARLDRLPIGSFHKQVMWLIAYVFFFELGDLNTFAFAAPALRVQWKLSIATIGIVTSAAFIGMFVGATTGGWFSDKVGRKKALLITTVWYSGFSLLNAFVWNVPGLFVTRFLTGVGLSAMTVVAITYISEIFPAKKRGTYQGWIMVIGLFGIPITAHVAEVLIPMFTYGWRLVFVWGALGMLILLFAHKIEESPRWYENHGRLVEADAALDRIEARIKADFGTLPPLGEEPPKMGRRGKFSDLFAPAYLPRTSMLIGAWIFQTLGFYGFMAWVPTLLAAHGFTLVKSLLWVSIMHFGAPLGAVIAALISDKFERKYLITITALVIAFCGLMYGLSFSMVPIIIFGFCVSMFIQTFAPLLYAYTPECYPTEIRNSGSGIGYGVGRLANGFGPLIVAFLFTNYGYMSVFIYIAATWLMCAIIISAFGPKTKGRTLV